MNLLFSNCYTDNNVKTDETALKVSSITAVLTGNGHKHLVGGPVTGQTGEGI